MERRQFVSLALTGLLATFAVPLRAGEVGAVQSVTVVVHTETDDKDVEEEVTIQVLFGKLIVAQGKYGGGQRWPDQTDLSFTMDLKYKVPANETDRMKLRITKSCHGSPTGCGWDASFEVTGKLDGGAEGELLPRTGVVRIGDNNPTSYEWGFQSII